MDYGYLKSQELRIDDILVIPTWRTVLGVVEAIEPETDWDGSRHFMVEYTSPVGGTGYVRFAYGDKIAIALWQTA